MRTHALVPLFVLLAIFGACAASLAQSNSNDQVMGHPGVCEEVRIAGLSATCSGRGLLYMHFANGTVIYLAPLSGGRTMAFIGNKDAQPDLHFYHLYLSRVRIETQGSSQVVQVAGECIAVMPPRQPVITRLDCNAEDENGKPYRLHFIGNRVKPG